MLGAPGGEIGVLIAMLLLVCLLGMILDWTGIVLLSVPIMLPVGQMMGYDVLWFVVMSAVILQTSFLTPPFGSALLYLKGIAPPGVETLDLYKAIIPFCLIIVFTCILLALFPGLILGLPKTLLG